MTVERESTHIPQDAFAGRLRRGELRYTGQLTLRDVLHLDHDPDYAVRGDFAVRLADTPFQFRAFDLPDSTLYIASFPPDAASLRGYDLKRVLWGAWPLLNRGHQYNAWDSQQVLMILDDWNILLEEKRRWDSHLQDIYDKHLAANPFVREIEDHHVRRFYEEISAIAGSEVHDELNGFRSALRPLKRTLGLLGVYTGTGEEAGQGAVDLRLRFMNFMREKYSWHSKSIEDAGDIYSGFLAISMWNRKEPIVDFVQHEMAGENREDLHLLTKQKTNAIPPLFVSEDDPAQVYIGLNSAFPSREIVPSTWKIRKLDNGLIEIAREDEASMLIAFVDDPKRPGYRKLQTVRNSTRVEDHGIVPLWAWEKNKTTRTRSYCRGPITPELVAAYPDLFDTRHDTLLGEIVVAAYSRKIRETLEAWLPMKGYAGKQIMKEGQMLLHVPMFANRYLQESPVIRELETKAA